MNKKVLIGVVSLVAITILLAISSKYIDFAGINSINVGNSTIESGIDGRSFIINNNLHNADPVLAELNKADIASYNIRTKVAPMPQEKGFFADTQTVGAEQINISGVDAEVFPDEKIIDLTIYVNSLILDEPDTVLMHINRNYLKGLLVASIEVMGEPESSQVRESFEPIVTEVLGESENNYFVIYE